MGGRSASVRRARRQRSTSQSGFVVTWDVDSADARMCGRVRRFVFGYTTTSHGREYRHAGFAERDGVRYLGQSVLFVTRHRFEELREFLHRNGVEHDVTVAAVGRRIPC